MNQNLAILVNELKNRARIYACIYRELSGEVGSDRAMAILKKAIHARGDEKGMQLAKKIGTPDLKRLAAAFMEGQADMDAFGHEVVEQKSDSLILRLNRCPLVEAWREAGLSPGDQKILCDIAYQVDFGKFETAGYRLSFLCRIAEGARSCDMKVTI